MYHPSNNTKLNAFTLPELIITMIILLVLYLLLSMVYETIVKDNRKSENKNRFFLSYSEEHHIVENDIDKCSFLFRKDSDAIIANIDNNRNVVYLFKDSFVLRSEGPIMDTLFPGGKINSISTFRDSGNLITAFSIRQFYGDNNFISTFSKTYSAQEYLIYLKRN